MFIFGVCAGATANFETICGPSLEPVLGREDELVVLRNQASIAEAYNAILDETSGRTDLEGVVLLHDDVELTDVSLLPCLRRIFADPSVGLVGLIGGAGKRKGMAWWTCEHLFGTVREQGHEYSYSRPEMVEVEVVDGLLMALSPSAARTCRFDQCYPAFQGYDADMCSQVQLAGLRVVVAYVPVIHHAGGAFDRPSAYRDWLTATMAWRSRWAPTKSRRAVARARLLCLPLERRVRPSTRRRMKAVTAKANPAP